MEAETVSRRYSEVLDLGDGAAERNRTFSVAEEREFREFRRNEMIARLAITLGKPKKGRGGGIVPEVEKAVRLLSEAAEAQHREKTDLSGSNRSISTTFFTKWPNATPCVGIQRENRARQGHNLDPVES